MKLIHINASYKPAWIYGGPTMSVAKLCESLVDSGVNIEVLTTLANGTEELHLESGKPTFVNDVAVTYYKRITKDHSHFSPALFWALRKKIKNDKGIIIHIHAWWNLVSIFSCLIAKYYHIPVVLSPRGMLTYYTQHNRNSLVKSVFHKIIGKSLLEYCHIHATSEKEKEDILQIIKPKSVSIIPNLVDIPTAALKENKREKDTEIFKILFLSRIEEKKGLNLLFEAIALVDFDWVLTIAGKGDTVYVNQLKLLAEQLKINDRIKWVGQIANEDKFNLMGQNDLLVLTSQNENFANVVVECLSTGTPVLISKQVGLYDYVIDNSFGWVTDLQQENIKVKLIEAQNNRVLRNQIRERAPAIIRKDYSSDNLIHQYFTLYNKLENGDL